MGGQFRTGVALPTCVPSVLEGLAPLAASLGCYARGPPSKPCGGCVPEVPCSSPHASLQAEPGLP
eukprot:2727476-Alexandrium_andersonii.AAC.1